MGVWCGKKNLSIIDFCFDSCRVKVFQFDCFEDVNLPDYYSDVPEQIRLELTHFYETRRCWNFGIVRNRPDLRMNFICTAYVKITWIRISIPCENPGYSYLVCKNSMTFLLFSSIKRCRKVVDFFLISDFEGCFMMQKVLSMMQRGKQK